MTTCLRRDAVVSVWEVCLSPRAQFKELNPDHAFKRHKQIVAVLIHLTSDIRGSSPYNLTLSEMKNLFGFWAVRWVKISLNNAAESETDFTPDQSSRSSVDGVQQHRNDLPWIIHIRSSNHSTKRWPALKTQPPLTLKVFYSTRTKQKCVACEIWKQTTAWWHRTATDGASFWDEHQSGTEKMCSSFPVGIFRTKSEWKQDAVICEDWTLGGVSEYVLACAVSLLH